MEALAKPCVSVAASANPNKSTTHIEDEGSHTVTESSFGAPSEKDRVVLTNTRALQGEQSTRLERTAAVPPSSPALTIS